MLTDGPVIEATAVAADIEGKEIDCRDADGFSLTFKWTGTLGGTWEVYVSNDEAGGGGGGVGYLQTTDTFTTNPTTGGGSGNQYIACSFKFAKVKLASVTGAGDLEAVVCVKDRKTNR